MIRTIKTNVYKVLYYLGITKLYYTLNKKKNGYTMLSYHNVLPPEVLENYYPYNVDTTTLNFEKQIKYILSKYTIGNPNEIVNGNPRHDIYISFDDGMLNNYTHALPILKKYNVKAIFAIIVGLVDGEIPYVWRDFIFLILNKLKGSEIKYTPFFSFETELVEANTINIIANKISTFLKEKMQDIDVYKTLTTLADYNSLVISDILINSDRFSVMDWEMIKDLKKEGHLIACHTLTHLPLKYASREDKKKEITTSKLILEERIGTDIDVFVYPYGNWFEVDANAVQIVEESNFKHAFMNIPKNDMLSKFTFPRVAIPNVSTISEIEASISGIRYLFKR